MKCSLLTLSCGLDGELSKERQAELEAHLVTCERCRTGMRYLREEAERISQLVRVALKPGTATALLERAKVVAPAPPADSRTADEAALKSQPTGPDPFNLMGVATPVVELGELAAPSAPPATESSPGDLGSAAPDAVPQAPALPAEAPQEAQDASDEKVGTSAAAGGAQEEVASGKDYTTAEERPAVAWAQGEPLGGDQDPHEEVASEPSSERSFIDPVDVDSTEAALFQDGPDAVRDPGDEEFAAAAVVPTSDAGASWWGESAFVDETATETGQPADDLLDLQDHHPASLAPEPAAMVGASPESLPSSPAAEDPTLPPAESQGPVTSLEETPGAEPGAGEQPVSQETTAPLGLDAGDQAVDGGSPKFAAEEPSTSWLPMPAAQDASAGQALEDEDTGPAFAADPDAAEPPAAAPSPSGVAAPEQATTAAGGLGTETPWDASGGADDPWGGADQAASDSAETASGGVGLDGSAGPAVAGADQVLEDGSPAPGSSPPAAEAEEGPPPLFVPSPGGGLDFGVEQPSFVGGAAWSPAAPLAPAEDSPGAEPDSSAPGAADPTSNDEMMQVALEESAVLAAGDDLLGHGPAAAAGSAAAELPPLPDQVGSAVTPPPPSLGGGWEPNRDLKLDLGDIRAAAPSADPGETAQAHLPLDFAPAVTEPVGAGADGPRPSVRPAAAVVTPERRTATRGRGRTATQRHRPPTGNGQKAGPGTPDAPRNWTRIATVAIAALAVVLIGWTLLHHSSSPVPPGHHVTSPSRSGPPNSGSSPAATPAATPAPAFGLTGTQSFGGGGSGYQVQNVRYGLHQNGSQLWVVFQLVQGSGPPKITTGFDGPQTLYVEMQGVAPGTAVAQPNTGNLVVSVEPGQVPGFTGAVYVLKLSRAAQVSGYLLPGSSTGSAGERVVLQLQ